MMAKKEAPEGSLLRKKSGERTYGWFT